MFYLVLALYLLLTAALSVIFSILFTLYCVQRPQQLIWKNKTVKYTNKPFKPRTNQLVRRKGMRRRIRELDTSSSSGYEPSTSGEAKRESGATTQRTRPTPGPNVTPPPCYNWRGPEMNMYQSEEEAPPPPYSSLSRRSSGSSRSSAHTVSLGEDSDERQLLIPHGDSSDSE